MTYQIKKKTSYVNIKEMTEEEFHGDEIFSY